MYALQLVYHSSIDGHLCGFHLLAVVDNAAMNMSVQISVWVLAFNSFLYVVRSEMTRLCDNSFKFFEEPSYCFSPFLFEGVTSILEPDKNSTKKKQYTN